MAFEAQVLAVVFGMAALAKGLIDALVAPVFEKYQLDTFWIMYIAWLVSGALVWFTGVNLFAEYIPTPVVGLILTAIVGGVGANVLHDISDK